MTLKNLTNGSTYVYEDDKKISEIKSLIAALQPSIKTANEFARRMVDIYRECSDSIHLYYLSYVKFYS